MAHGHLFTYARGVRATATLGSIRNAGNTSNVASLGTLLLGAPDVDHRLALTGDPNALNRDFARYFDPTRLALAGVYPNADGRGTRDYLARPGNFANDMTLAKAFRIHESHAFELRAAFYNAFSQVRRASINTSLQYNANRRACAESFSLFNTPRTFGRPQCEPDRDGAVQPMPYRRSATPT